MGNMGLTIFDIDDTLFHTTAQIKVIKDGKVVRSLTNQEFNNYELQPGEEFDFGEFRSAEKFAKESEPIKPMINTLKRILDRAANTKVIMLTARADFDDKDKFLSTFEKYGIDMSRIHVHRAGNLPGDEPPAYKKAVWVRKYLNTGKYNRVNLIDDSMTKLKVFKSLEQEYPNVDFDAYFVKSSGSVAVVSESRRKKKSRQRKQNSLFSRNTYGGYGAWGPGPYGGYGYDSGYSGDGGGEAESIKEKLDSYGNVQGDPIGDLIKNLDKQKTNPAKSSTKSPVVKKDTGQAAQPATITGNALEKTLRDFALKAGIKGKELAQFLAQCAHESANYSTLVEFGASQDFLKKYDKQFSPDKAKELGNTAPGDGERFKGRGFIQLTGRWNYTQAGQALGLPLDNKPELLEKPDIAAKASVWFWKNRVQPNVRNFTDTRTVTSYINPGLRGLQKRHGLFQNYLQTMQKTVKENVIQNMEFIDVYLRGRHKGNMITKSVAKNFPNRKLDQLIQYLIDKHGVNPSAIVYGPSKDNTTDEDYHPNDPPPGPETKPTMPKGTVRIDVSDVYDWYKLGQHISNLKGLGKHDFGKGPPSTIISFGSEEEEHKYIQDLMKLGLTTTDIDPIDPNQPRNMPKQKVDPTFKVDENFADGRNPQDKGDSARHGIPKKSSISTLKKIRSSDTASPRKKQLAHWQINMRQGKKRSSK
jgi:putative chitinase